MKAAFNQEKALVGAFSKIVQLHRLINLRHYFIPSSNDQPIKSAIVDTKNLKLFRSATDRWNKTDFVPISFSPRRDICVSCLLIIILTRHYQSLFGPSQLVATIFIKRMINLAAAATWVIHPAGGRPRQQQNAELFSERGERGAARAGNEGPRRFHNHPCPIWSLRQYSFMSTNLV